MSEVLLSLLFLMIRKIYLCIQKEKVFKIKEC